MTEHEESVHNVGIVIIRWRMNCSAEIFIAQCGMEFFIWGLKSVSKHPVKGSRVKMQVDERPVVLTVSRIGIACFVLEPCQSSIITDNVGPHGIFTNPEVAVFINCSLCYNSVLV